MVSRGLIPRSLFFDQMMLLLENSAQQLWWAEVTHQRYEASYTKSLYTMRQVPIEHDIKIAVTYFYFYGSCISTILGQCQLKKTRQSDDLAQR